MELIKGGILEFYKQYSACIFASCKKRLLILILIFILFCLILEQCAISIWHFGAQ